MGQLPRPFPAVSPHSVHVRSAPSFSLCFYWCCFLLIVLYVLATIPLLSGPLSVWPFTQAAEVNLLLFCTSHPWPHPHHKATEAHSTNAVRHLLERGQQSSIEPKRDTTNRSKKQIHSTLAWWTSEFTQAAVSLKSPSEPGWHYWSSLHHWWQHWRSLLHHWMQLQQRCCWCHLWEVTWGSVSMTTMLPFPSLRECYTLEKKLL